MRRRCAGGTYPPLTAAIRSAWIGLTEDGTGRHHFRNAALAVETSLFELVFVATWLVTVPAAANSAGGAIAGLIVDQPGGIPWSFMFAATVIGAATVVAAWPAGPISRADAAVAAHALAPDNRGSS